MRSPLQNLFWIFSEPPCMICARNQRERIPIDKQGDEFSSAEGCSLEADSGVGSSDDRVSGGPSTDSKLQDDKMCYCR